MLPLVVLLWLAVVFAAIVVLAAVAALAAYGSALVAAVYLQSRDNHRRRLRATRTRRALRRGERQVVRELDAARRARHVSPASPRAVTAPTLGAVLRFERRRDGLAAVVAHEERDR